MSKFLKAFLFVSLVFAPFAASAVTVASWGVLIQKVKRSLC